MVSSISQVISERIDQARSVLFLIWGRKDYRGNQKIDDWQVRPSVPSMSGISDSPNSIRWNAAFQIAMKLHQILVNRPCRLSENYGEKWFKSTRYGIITI